MTLLTFYYRRAARGRQEHIFDASDAGEPLCGYELNSRSGYSRWYGATAQRPRSGRICAGCDRIREQREEQANLRARILADEIEQARS